MRTITMEVFGERVTKSTKAGGVQGENAATAVNLTLDASWDGYGKRVVWRDALGENPVVTVLITPLLAQTEDRRSFSFVIPGEPLAEPGLCSFTVEGYREVDGVHQVALTVRDVLVVYPSDTAACPVTPSAGEGEQIMEALAGAEETFEGLAKTAKSWAVGGTETRAGEDTDNAAYYAEVASARAQEVTAVSGSVAQTIEKVNGMTAGVSDLPAGSPATAALSTEDGHFVLNLGIPAGAKGDKGEVGPKGDTGEQGPEGEQGPKGDTGAQGPQGETGADGFSPVVQTSKTGRTTTITITDKDGTHTATVLDGAGGSGSGDMSCATYDTDGDGVVDDSARLGGQLPAYYATAAGLTAHAGDTSNPHGVTAAQVGADASGSAAAVQSSLTAHMGDTSHITASERSAWNAKQAALTFDTAPAAGSTNPVTSGGVKTALDAKLDKSGGTMTGALNMGIEYITFGENNSINQTADGELMLYSD